VKPFFRHTLNTEDASTSLACLVKQSHSLAK